MKKNTIKKAVIVLFASFFAALLTMSCRSTHQSSSFVKTNADSIQTLFLDNGIPLIIKQNSANQIRILKLIYRGGSALLTPEKAGIEALTLSLLARGSKKYSYEDVRRIQYEKSSAIGLDFAGYDFSSFRLISLDSYWDNLFEVYSDCLLNPAFDEKQFALVRDDFKIRLQKEASDPYSFAITSLHDKIFLDHPYAASPMGTIASVSSISIEDVKSWYAESLTTDRMFILAVGNFDAEVLKKQLNKTFGILPKTSRPFAEVQEYNARQGLFLEAFPKSEGIAYLRGDYPAPSVDSPDFITLQFANSILGELLFSIVRTKHGACYSAWAGAHGFKNSYGSLVVYKTDQASNSKRYADDAIAVLASGKTLNPKAGSSAAEGPYVPLSGTIEIYKAKFINSFFANQQSNAQAAEQLALSYVYNGDPQAYLHLIDKIHAITADDVIRVVKTYLINDKTSWIIVSDQASLDAVDVSVFEKFTGILE